MWSAKLPFASLMENLVPYKTTATATWNKRSKNTQKFPSRASAHYCRFSVLLPPALRWGYRLPSLFLCEHVCAQTIIHPPLQPHDSLLLITPQSRDLCGVVTLPPPPPTLHLSPRNLPRNSDLVPKKQHKEALHDVYGPCTVPPLRNAREPSEAMCLDL